MNAVFPGHRIIRPEQTASTNRYLLRLSDTERLPEGSIVITDNQTQGRGQGENVWESAPGCNLTFSVILYPVSVEASGQFILSKALSLAVYDFVSQITPGVSVKWPNDVYVDNRKIAGILIENFIEGAYVNKSVAGIGVNVNQDRFTGDAPNPVSLRQLTGKDYRLEECLETLHRCIALRYRMVARQERGLHADYLRHMYRFARLSRFCAAGEHFEATITGVNKYGMLELTTPENQRRIFGFREITFE